MNKILMRIAVLSLALLAVPTSQAVPINLLTNAGFETGDFTGWSVSGTSSSTGVATDGVPIAGTDFTSFVNVRSGNFAAFAEVQQFNPEQQIFLTQTISVLEATTYSMGYFASTDSTTNFGFGNVNDQCTGNCVDILIDGVSTGASHPGIITSGSTPSAFILVSSSFTTGIGQTSVDVTYSASASGISVGLSLDDFFFTGEPGLSVPEPTALTLIALGLAGIGFRRKQLS